MPIAIAGVGVVIAALAALLASQGNNVLGRWLVNVIPGNIPLIGSWLRDRMREALAGAVAAIEVFLDDAMTPIIAVIAGPAVRTMGLIDSLTGAVADLWNTAHRIITYSIPAGVALAEHAASDLVNWAVGHVAGVIWQTRAELLGDIDTAKRALSATIGYVFDHTAAAIASLVHTVTVDAAVARTYTTDLVGWAVGHIAGVIWQTRAELAADIAGVQAFAARGYHDLLGFIGDTATRLEAFAGYVAAQAAGRAVAELDATVAAGLADVWPQVAAGAVSVEGVIATDFPELLADLRAIPRSVPLDVADAAVGVGAVAVPLLRYLAECGIPNCRNLGTLGRDLQGLLQLVEGAAFLGLVAELAHNPTGAARDIRAVAGTLAEDTITVARDLITAA